MLLLEGIGAGVALPLAYLWTFVFLDSQFSLPFWARLLACLGLVGVVAALAQRLYQKSRLLRLSEDQVALAIERHLAGGIDNRLINALQLARGSGIGETEWSEAAVQENYICLQQVRLPRPAAARPAYLKLGLALLLILLGLLCWKLRPDLVNAASRVLMPFPDPRPIRVAVPEVTPDKVEAPALLSVVRVRWDYPAYIGKPSVTTEQANGNLEALRRTKAEITFVFDHPVTNAILYLDRAGLRNSVSGLAVGQAVWTAEILSPTNSP